MPETPDVGAIAQQVKARIKHIEEQLTHHEKLTDELERLRGALSRLRPDDGLGDCKDQRRQRGDGEHDAHQDGQDR
jgi:hypothetical protein